MCFGCALMVKRVSMVAGVVVGATLAILLWRGDDAPTSAQAATSPPRVVTADERLAAVERVVNARNQGVGDEVRKFEADGWVMVSESPPDESLTEFDPGLLGKGQEEELRVQMASTVPAPRHARRIAQIAVTAREPATREAAADALGRINTEEAREAIIDILTGGKLDPDDLGRRQLTAYLRPADLDDPQAAKIAGLLDSEKLTGAEHQQIAFNLALIGIRDGMTLTDTVLETLSPEARALISQMTELGSKSFLAHSHAHRD
jgi:hypothetical protein